MPWWRQGNGLRRLIIDLVRERLALSRSAALVPSSQSLLLAEDWTQAPIALDSLELMECATQFAQRLHLDSSGLEDLLLMQPSLTRWQHLAQTSLDRDARALSFFSSGSTATPQRYPLPSAHLESEVAFFAEILPRAASRRIWSVVPAHHIYGFIFTVLLPVALPEHPEVRDARGRMLSSLQREMAPGDLIVAVPDFWQQWCRSGTPLPSGIIAVSAAAKLDDTFLHHLTEQGAWVLDVYGASECGGIGYRHAAHAPFTLLPHWRKDGERLVSAQHSALPPDRIEWLDARHFHVTGRHDGVVQIAGHNVDPDAITRVLMQHPSVRDAAVREHAGRLKAFIVARATAVSEQALITELDDWLAQRLPPWQRPKFYTFGECLPRNALGKLTDWPLAGAITPPPDATSMAS